MKKCGTRRPSFFHKEKLKKIVFKGKLNPILHNVRKHSSYP